MRWVAKIAAIVTLGVVACSDPGHTEEVKPEPLERQRKGDNAYLAALTAYGRFDDAATVRELDRALQISPNHPRALASGLLFDVPQLSGAKRTSLLDRARTTLKRTDVSATDRVLLNAAVVYRQTGARQAARALESESAIPNHELAYWRATLSYRARDYETANRGYYQLLRSERRELRGRIYDHYIRVLLHFGSDAEALVRARAFRRLLPKRRATTRLLALVLIENNELNEAQQLVTTLGQGERAAALRGRLAASRGQFSLAIRHYTTAVAKAPSARKGYWLASLALMQWFAGKPKQRAQTLTRCLEDSQLVRGKPLCAWLAAVRDPATEDIERVKTLAKRLDTPDLLVGMLRAEQVLPDTGCMKRLTNTTSWKLRRSALVNTLSLLRRAYFPGTQYVPLFRTIVGCYQANVTELNDKSATFTTLDQASKTKPLLLLTLASLQVYTDPNAALATLALLAKRLPHLDQDSVVSGSMQWIEDRAKKLNAKPKPGN